jgi:hypothetical protein
VFAAEALGHRARGIDVRVCQGRGERESGCEGEQPDAHPAPSDLDVEGDRPHHVEVAQAMFGG